MKSNTYRVGIIFLSTVSIDILLCEPSAQVIIPEHSNEYHPGASFDIFDACLGEPTEVCGDISSHLASGPSWSTQWYEHVSLMTQQWAVSLLCRYCAVRQWLAQRIWQEKKSEC